MRAGSGASETITSAPPDAAAPTTGDDAAPAPDASAVDAAAPAATLPLPAPDCATLLTPKVLAKVKKPTVTSIEGGCAITQAGKPLMTIDVRCAPLGPEWWERAKALLPPMPSKGARDMRGFGFNNEGIPCVSAATGELPYGKLQDIHEPIRAAMKSYIIATYGATPTP